MKCVTAATSRQCHTSSPTTTIQLISHYTYKTAADFQSGLFSRHSWCCGPNCL